MPAEREGSKKYSTFQRGDMKIDLKKILHSQESYFVSKYVFNIFRGILCNCFLFSRHICANVTM